MVKCVVCMVVAIAACKGKGKDPGDPGSAAPAVGSAAVDEAQPPPSGTLAEAPKIDGPSVTPTLTTGITFVTPADSSFWGELNFSCYRAVMSLTGTKTAGEAFEKLSPTVPAAMKAGGIDLGRDLAAIGGFDCGGSPCLYVAATLAKPEKFGEVLKVLLPNTPPIEVAKGHYKLDTPGSRGTRTIHIRVVPIQWGGKLPTDAWSQEAAKATHVVFIGGIDGKNVDLDPVTKLADAQTALAKVKDAEGTVADARGRCMLGLVGPRDFQPGFKLERARFAVAAPPAGNKSDALMTLLGSRRTLGVEVELVLAPAPAQKDVDGWIAMGKMYLGAIGANVRGSVGDGPLMDIYFDMASMVGMRAFKPVLDKSSLRLSWRTDRIPGGDLDALERRLQAVMAPTP